MKPLRDTGKLWLVHVMEKPKHYCCAEFSFGLELRPQLCPPHWLPIKPCCLIGLSRWLGNKMMNDSFSSVSWWKISKLYVRFSRYRDSLQVCLVYVSKFLQGCPQSFASSHEHSHLYLSPWWLSCSPRYLGVLCIWKQSLSLASRQLTASSCIEDGKDQSFITSPQSSAMREKTPCSMTMIQPTTS